MTTRAGCLWTWTRLTTGSCTPTVPWFWRLGHNQSQTLTSVIKNQNFKKYHSTFVIINSTNQIYPNACCTYYSIIKAGVYVLFHQVKLGNMNYVYLSTIVTLCPFFAQTIITHFASLNDGMLVPTILPFRVQSVSALAQTQYPAEIQVNVCLARLASQWNTRHAEDNLIMSAPCYRVIYPIWCLRCSRKMHNTYLFLDPLFFIVR